MNPTQEPQAASAVPETSKALTKFQEQHAKEVGLPSPQAVNYMFSIANMLYSSALVGKDMGLSKDQIARLREFGVTGPDLEEREREAVKANSIAKMLVGHELGIEPMAALMDVDIVKAKIFIRYPQLHRLIEEKGWEIEEVERSNVRAAILLTHKTRKPRTFEFTIEDAKTAGLTKRGGYNGDSPSQYELRPRVMLWSRVISEAYRATGGKGSVYTPEEKSEIMQEDIREELQRPAAAAENPYAPKIKKDAPERGPASGPASEAHEVQVEGPDTSTRAEAGSSAPAQQAGESGGAVAAALPKSDAGRAGEAVTSSVTPEPEKQKVTPISKSKQDPRVPELLAQIEKLLPAKQRKKIAEDYLRGYFNVTDVKAVMQDPRMFDAATMLLALCGDWRVQLIGDPHKYGVAAKLGWDKLQNFIKDWPEEQQNLARQMALQYADTGGEGLYDYFAALDLDKADPENRGAFLAVVWRIGIGKSASALWDCGMPIKDVVAGWGLDIPTCEPAEIVARIGDLEPDPVASAMAAGEEEEPSFDLFERGGSEDLEK